MARWKKPTKEQVSVMRQDLAEQARRGGLHLPDAVVDMRKSIGLTQQEFANTLGLTRRQVAEIEAGTANPTLETLDKVGRLFGFAVGFVPKLRQDP
ncbi:helix-turn-helix transcriptional regulator [Sinorhizobium sp. NFACC03]|uniref:helix-turn-helix domain-containing protein n=1 Tax=Sinorhizobium sp. NFACC03 TaxID=1566295 RepID=UPI00088A260D|nr:helix-turn-helix transcriptional regulator [Sinorhizobium sp. NFACC03]SDA99624.1 Helix-turn-helix [Sinorhizobium sp. NFACC03]